jgi:hypothetical protein
MSDPTYKEIYDELFPKKKRHQKEGLPKPRKRYRTKRFRNIPDEINIPDASSNLIASKDNARITHDGTHDGKGGRSCTCRNCLTLYLTTCWTFLLPKESGRVIQEFVTPKYRATSAPE